MSGPKPASQAKLATLVLRQSDLPTGWTGAAHQNDPSAAQFDAQLSSCVGIRNTDPDRYVEAYSQDFSHPDGLVPDAIGSTASSYLSQSDLSADEAKLASPKTAGCLKQLAMAEASSQLPAGATISSLDFTLTPHPSGYPSNVVAIGEAHAVVLYSGIKIYIDALQAFMVGPRIEASVNVTQAKQARPAAGATLSAWSVAKAAIVAVATRTAAA